MCPTLPPVYKAPNTCPSSWVTCIPIQHSQISPTQKRIEFNHHNTGNHLKLRVFSPNVAIGKHAAKAVAKIGLCKLPIR